MCQILQAPSWLTMHGPTGVLGLHTFPNSLQSAGSAIPLSYFVAYAGRMLGDVFEFEIEFFLGVILGIPGL